MNDVVAALIAKGFTLPTSVVKIGNQEPSSPSSPKVEIYENEITKP